MSWEDAMANWDNLAGNVLINLSGAGLKLEKESVSAGVKNLILWGDNQEEQVDLEVAKGLGATGICEKIEFHNLETKHR